MGVHFHSQFRNPLAYPAGYAPGFDPNHIASGGIVFSGVASGGNFSSILKGQVGAITGAPTSEMQEFGPCTYYSAASSNSAFAGHLVAQPADFTIGFITNHDGTVGNTTMFDSGSGGGATNGWVIQCSAGQIGLRNSPSFAASNPSINLVANTWYFAVITQSAAANVIHWLYRDLRTGKLIIPSTGTALTAGGNGNGTIGIGGPILKSNHRIAAAMYSQKFTPMPVLRQWAADPWSFWYPNPGDNWIAAQASGFPYWGVQNNNFVIGTGIQ